VQAYSCTVGKKPSQARAFLNDVEEVHNLLSSLVRCSKVRARVHMNSHVTHKRAADFTYNHTTITTHQPQTR